MNAAKYITPFSSGFPTLIIKLATMADPDDSHFMRRIVYDVTDAPVADSNAPYSFFTPNFYGSGWTGIRAECDYSGDDTVLDGAVESL
jgi:hypothetical protein